MRICLKRYTNKVKRKVKKILKYLQKLYMDIRYKNAYCKQLENILKQYHGLPVIIFPPLLDWNIPLFQRPQHIAINLAKQGYLYFFCTINDYDHIRGFRKINKTLTLYVTDQYDLLLKRIKCKVLHMYAQDFSISSSFVKNMINRHNIILYEYVDALTEELYVSRDKVIDKHLTVLKDERCIVICTANKLMEEVTRHRTKNYALVTNGVEYDHFHRTIKPSDVPDKIQHILEKGCPVIGYFGAIAKWFDYELIKRLAGERSNYEILLIGWSFDGSMSESFISGYDNIHIIGPVDYKILPFYAYWFDVSIIPFQINDITRATSPIKLFEYMAIGRPIVSTNIPECRKYQSVLIAKDHSEFIDMIDNALKLREDKWYNDIIKRDALENSWDSKALQINELIKKNLHE